MVVGSIPRQCHHELAVSPPGPLVLLLLTSFPSKALTWQPWQQADTGGCRKCCICYCSDKIIKKDGSLLRFVTQFLRSPADQAHPSPH